MNLLDVKNYEEDGKIAGVKVLWEKPGVTPEEYIVGRDTSQSFISDEEGNDVVASNSAIWQDTLPSGGILQGDTAFIDYNLLEVNADGKNSPFGELRMGYTYYYRVAKVTGGTPSSWSNYKSIKYGMDDEDNYVISTCLEFNDLAQQYNAGDITGNISVLLAQDLTFTTSGDTLLPLGNKLYPFQGTFDGQNHSIIVHAIDQTEENVGVFGCIKNANISRLKLTYGAKVDGGSIEYLGALVGQLMGKSSIDTVEIDINADFEAGTAVGGMIGGGEGSVVATSDTITISADLIAEAYAGGLAGQLGGTQSVITNCGIKQANNIKAEGTGATVVAGGMVGVFGGKITSSIVNIVTSIKATDGTACYAGGMVGYEPTTGSEYSFSTVNTVSEKVTAGTSGTNQAAAGYFIGYSKADEIDEIALSSVMGVEASASGDACAGGLVGRYDNSSGSIKAVRVTLAGDIKATSSTGNSYAGMVAGKVDNISSNSIGAEGRQVLLNGAGMQIIAEASNGMAYLGGAVGHISKTSFKGINVSEVSFTATAKKAYVGGVTGMESNKGSAYDSVVVASTVVFGQSLSTVDTLVVGALAGSSKMNTLGRAHISAKMTFTDNGFADNSVIMGGLCGELYNSAFTVPNTDLSLPKFAAKVGKNSKIGSIAGDLTAANISMDEATLANITLTELSVQENSYVGGLCGKANITNGTIDYDAPVTINISSSATSGMSYVGGLFGLFSANVATALIDTSAEGIAITIDGSSLTAGGLVGQADEAKLSECRVRGATLTGKGNGTVAGMVGLLSGNSTIKKSSAKEITLLNAQKAGGIVGKMSVSSTSYGITESFCYNITSNEVDTLGLLVGQMDQGLINYSYALHSAIGETVVVGGFIGYMTGGQILNSYAAHFSSSEPIKVCGTSSGGDTTGAVISENKIFMSDEILGEGEWMLASTISYPNLVSNPLTIPASDEIYNDLKMDKEDGYYQIVKPVQLDAIGDVRLVGGDYNDLDNFYRGLQLTDSYKVANDLDFTGYENYTPIGYSSQNKHFGGILDGDHHTISNLTSKAVNSVSSARGILGSMDAGTVQKLRIVNAEISGTEQSAVVCGILSGGIIQQIVVDSSQINNTTGSGAIVVGEMTGGTLRDVLTRYNSVNCLLAAGGIAGEVLGGDISKAVSVVDSIFSNLGSVGGLAVSVGAGASLDSSLSIAKVLMTNSEGKEIYKVANKQTSSTLTANYTVAETKVQRGESNANYIVGTDPADAQGGNLFFRMFVPFFDEDDLGYTAPIWGRAKGDRYYPYLAGFYDSDETPDAIAITALDGPITVCATGDTIYITEATGLSFLEGYLDDKVTHVILQANIEFAENDKEESNFNPITKIDGKTFDGQGHTIKGLKIKSESENVGLFGTVDNCTIKNLALIDCQVTGGASTSLLGGVAGLVKRNSIIEDVYVGESKFTAENNSATVGPVAGSLASGSTVQWSIALHNQISATNGFAGGLVGNKAENAIIRNCVVAIDTVNASQHNRITTGGSQNLSDNYAWSGNSATGDKGTDKLDGSSFVFSNILSNTFYTNTLNFIDRDAWGWASGDDKDDFRCMPALSHMSTATDEDCYPEVIRFSGNGNGDDVPYQIENIDQLELVQAFLSKNFTLTNNIIFPEDYDVDDATENGNWLPLGWGNTTTFTGTIDGDGYCIQGMKINLSNGEGVGFIDKIGDDAIIKSLSFYDGYVYSSGTTPTGVLYGSSGVAKAIVTDVLVKNYTVVNTGATDKNYVGAIAGNAVGDELSSCISVQNVVKQVGQPTSIAGGITGSGGAIATCLAVNDTIGAVINQYRIGGSTPTGNYSFRRTSKLNTNTNTSDPLKTMGEANDVDGAPISLLSFVESFYENTLALSFDEQWKWPSASSEATKYHPVGINVPATIDSGYIDWSRFGIEEIPTFVSGDGTSSNPYLISDEQQLGYMQYGSEQYYKLAANITLNNEWTPVGSQDMPFQGYLDGDGHYIKGMTQSAPDLDAEETAPDRCSGLLGYIKSADGDGYYVKNIAFIDANITAGNFVGVLAGEDSSAQANPYTYSDILLLNNTVSGLSEVGGLLGDAPSATIKNLVVAGGSIRGTGSYVGGAVGKDVRNLYNIVVAADTIEGVNDMGKIYGGTNTGPSESVYGWYFTEFENSSSNYDPRTNNDGENGTIASVEDMSSAGWWASTLADFNDSWDFTSNGLQLVPSLKNMDYDTLVMNSMALAKSSGTYTLTEPKHLTMLHVYPDSSYQLDIAGLTGDDNFVDLTDYENNWRLDLNDIAGGNWTPIANFTGELNGMGGGLIGLNVQTKVEGYQGFIAQATGNAKVENFGIYKSTFAAGISGVTAQGALAGNIADNAEISYIWSVKNEFSGNVDISGGIVGQWTDPASLSSVLTVFNDMDKVNGSTAGGAIGKIAVNQIMSFGKIVNMGDALPAGSHAAIGEIDGSVMPSDIYFDDLYLTVGDYPIEDNVDFNLDGIKKSPDNFLASAPIWSNTGFGSSDLGADTTFNAIPYNNDDGDDAHYPTQIGIPQAIASGLLKPMYFAGGDGTEENPYQVANARGLKFVGNALNVDKNYYYKQTADIDMSKVKDFWPIGLSNANNRSNTTVDGFSGYYNGDGYQIYGLHLAEEVTTGVVGLFSKVLSGKIHDVAIDSATIVADGYGGVIAGEIYGNDTKVEDCRVTRSSITKDESTVLGGIVGKLYAGTITRCVVVASNIINRNGTEGDSFAGGIAGVGLGNITHCAVLGGTIEGYDAHSICGNDNPTNMSSNYVWEGTKVISER